MAKTQTPAPIDRPLARAYLREFSGWSTNYPPGISEPTSLRLMENMQVQRDGALRVRPGLRALTPAIAEPTYAGLVGSFEPFFLNNGDKAYLFAVREFDGTVGFRVLTTTGVHELADAGVDFTVVGGSASLNFQTATSYVKYLQIDNKIFALSNAGESMRYFTVGTTKVAKRLNSLERPAWNVSDKLTVVQPTQAWINSGVPTGVRTNLANNPQFEASLLYWAGGANVYGGSYTTVERTTAQAMVGGSYSARLGIHATRINWFTQPLGPASSGIGSWAAGGGLTSKPGYTFGYVSGKAHATVPAGTTVNPGEFLHVNGPPLMRTDRIREIYGSTPPVHWLEFDYQSTGMSGTGMVPGVRWRWYNSGGVQVGADVVSISPSSVVGSRYQFYVGTVPSGAVSMQVFPFFYNSLGSTITLTGGATWDIWNASFMADPENGAGFFDGGSGTDFIWSGTANDSASYYVPGFPIEVDYQPTGIPVSAGLDYAVSAYVRAATVVATFRLDIEWHTPSGVLSTDSSTTSADVNTSWATRLSKVATAPVGATAMVVKIVTTTDVEWHQYHYVDELLVEQSSSVNAFFDGSFTDLSTVIYSWAGTPNDSDSLETTYSAPTAVPTAATPTANTLIGDPTGMAALTPPAANSYNFGFFYTFSNEVGESAPSQVTVVKAQRGWSMWKWETANASAEPSGTHTDDPNLCADQLVAYMPNSVFLDALDQGAIAWNLYMLTWSDQDAVPVSAVRLGTRALVPGAAHGTYGYQRMTPQQADANALVASLPSEVNRFNYSTPSSAGQGIVAADRMVMVFDPVAPAVIRWSSAEMGNYSDFTASKGGGFKTLSMGNLFVPACVVLWQNPQSADTLTIMCLGTDGRSTGYYMAPAQIASQSEATNIMGFEETTATPGTTSPYGCEVHNNALYHPLDDQLMKSTATNYNINHSSLTDPIQNMWMDLADKEHIVSAVHDNRIYYLVHNTFGAALEPGCWGNEVWVFDAMQKMGSWSRWLVQGQSLKRIEQHGVVAMSVVRPDGIFYFDETKGTDDFIADGFIDERNIPWLIETNTQGANRAHDAWCHLQQAGVIVGNLTGQFRYGVRGLDTNGKMQDISKIIKSPADPVDAGDGTMFDLEDWLQVRRDMKEWFFYASSVTVDDEVQASIGQINLAQYRYTPVSVNVGYELGSIETFEYGAVADRQALNGIPYPYIDTGRP